MISISKVRLLISNSSLNPSKFKPLICQLSTDPINKYTERTHNCGQITKQNLGREVTLFGWVQYTRFDNKIIALRDSYGVIQCVIRDEELRKSLKKVSIYNESVIKVVGNVQARPPGQESANEQSPTGSLEIVTKSIDIISKSKKDLPILTRDSTTNEAQLNNKLKHPYLHIRRANMQHALRFRSHVCRILRNKLYELNFVECETPTLFNRTPGGANEFIVPSSKEAKKFYSLVQSPQQLKQLLMIGGLDRYFQICRCYRDERGRSDRQPEFTQLDIELSFTNQNLVIKLVNDLVYTLMSNISAHDESMQKEFLKSFFGEEPDIRAISFKKAFDNYGTDKPDLRFDWKIESEDNNLNLKVPFGIDDEQEFAELVLNPAKDTIRLNSEIEICKLDKETVIKIEGKCNKTRMLLGSIRNLLAHYLHSIKGHRVYEQTFAYLWVVDFPLFTLDNQTGRIKPNHHPFTAPTEETVHLLESDPLSVIGKHYDLVLNGQEIAGGSIRIHDPHLQTQIFQDILGEDSPTFEYFIEALQSGCPPHGGIAFGLDRLVAILMQKNSIRDVIAFPKSASGRDLMTGCPEELSPEVRKLYHIGY